MLLSGQVDSTSVALLKSPCALRPVPTACESWGTSLCLLEVLLGHHRFSSAKDARPAEDLSMRLQEWEMFPVLTQGWCGECCFSKQPATASVSNCFHLGGKLVVASANGHKSLILGDFCRWASFDRSLGSSSWSFNEALSTWPILLPLRRWRLQLLELKHVRELPKSRSEEKELSSYMRTQIDDLNAATPFVPLPSFSFNSPGRGDLGPGLLTGFLLKLRIFARSGSSW